MSTDIRLTNAWDTRYNLPTCPNHNNAFIYMGYINQIDMGLPKPRPSSWAINLVAFRDFFDSCMQDGIFYRWPDRKEGEASWDEILGAASISPYAAQVLLDNFRFKWNRFVFLKAFLRCRKNILGGPSWWDKLLIEAWILLTIKGNLAPGDAGGRLKNWLIISKTGVLKDYWARKMTTHGYTLRNSLEIEPGDNPWLAENAKESWF